MTRDELTPLLALLALSASVLPPALASAQVLVCEIEKLKGLDTSPGDTFGRGAVIQGDTIVIGARGSDLGAPSAGAVYVFDRSGGAWTQVQKIGKPAAQASDEFGRTLALSGQTLLVGLRGDDGLALNAGAAFIFERTNGNFEFAQKLTAFDGAANDNFGWAADIQGDRLVIGAPADNPVGTNSGSVHCYQRSGPTWVHAQKLNASDGSFNDRFGGALLLDGDRLFVGAPDAGPSSSQDIGAIYVFARSGETWTEVQKLTPPDGADSDKFGEELAVLGDTLFVTAIGADGTGPGGTVVDLGAVYVYRIEAGSWVLKQKISGPEGFAFDLFGSAVAAEDGRLVVGSSPSSAGPSLAGADVFEFIDDEWTRIAKLEPFGFEGGTGFGRTVDMSGGTILVGAELQDDDGHFAGVAHLFPAGSTDCNDNGIADHCDLAQGASTDWDANGTLDECETCAGDLNLSFTVNGADIALLLAQWDQPGFTDIDHDGTTGGADLALLLGAWGPCAP